MKPSNFYIKGCSGPAPSKLKTKHQKDQANSKYNCTPKQSLTIFKIIQHSSVK